EGLETGDYLVRTVLPPQWIATNSTNELAIISRLLWELKISPIFESPVDTRQRAKQAAELLIQEYHHHGSVVLIAQPKADSLILVEKFRQQFISRKTELLIG
ncbi:MAG: hypothetical protein AAFR37_07880, partial [Cyanobacteria bacterium J06628_3]